MSSGASSSQRIDGSGSSLSARCGQGAIAFIFALVLLSGTVWTDGNESHAVAAIPSDVDSDVVVLSLANLGFPVKSRAEAESPDDAATHLTRSDTGHITESAAELARPEPPAAGNAWRPEPLALWADPVAYGRQKVLPKFAAAYQSVLKQVALAALPRIREYAALTNAILIGTASTYNPYRDGPEEGNAQTASGELYDPAAWTAAIQIDLREQFGGIRYGEKYQPAFALVESGEKQIIVKINDVGPLKPGRVIDLNERSMRYFDPFLQRGLLSDARITLLPGADWTPGPVGGEPLISFASAQ
jgi:rare lipoprotein A